MLWRETISDGDSGRLVKVGVPGFIIKRDSAKDGQRWKLRVPPKVDGIQPASGTSLARNKVAVCDELCQVIAVENGTLKCITSALAAAPQLNKTLAEEVNNQPLLQRIWPIPARRINVLQLTGTTPLDGQGWFDGDPYTTSTAGTSRTIACEILMDSVPGAYPTVVEVEKLRVITSYHWETAKHNFPRGVKLWGRRSRDSWQEILTLPTVPTVGWFEQRAHDSAKGVLFSSLKLNNTNPGYRGCRFAELELVGRIYSGTTSGRCPVTVSSGGVIPDDKTTFDCTYAASATPRVVSVFPSSGTTAGGTLLTLMGFGFASAGAPPAIVIDAVACALKSHNATTLQCVTGRRVRHVRPAMTVTIPGKGAAVIAAGTTFIYRDMWSASTTWGGFPPPPRGFSAVIPPGQNIFLDVNPPQLVLLLVEGFLEFSDDADRTLDASYILLRNGTLIVGREETPFQHQATITLHGKPIVTPELPLFGAKTLAVRGGSVDLHGMAVTPSWTQLGATAQVGDAFVTLRESVTWTVGQRIVIASSNFSMHEAEEVTITSVQQGNRTIGISPPLQYRHWGELLWYEGRELDMRAEVAVLSRNVKIRGDSDSAGLQWGATIMLHSPHGNDSAVGRFSNLECEHCGQAFNLGRYPIHMHMIGAVHRSFIKNCSIHHAFNRAVTIHGVHWLRLMHTVAFDVLGHTFFMEDGIETKNTLHHNLGLVTRSAASLLNSDATPATFWITNPDNFFTNNAAAGSDRYGFWFDLPKHPGGASATTEVCPRGTPLGRFDRNRAHSNGRYGLRLFKGLIPRKHACDPFVGLGDHRSQDDLGFLDHRSNPPIPAVFTRFTSYKNGRVGAIATVVGAVVFHRFALADNRRAGVEVQVVEAPAGQARTTDSLIVGYSAVQGREPLVPADVFDELFVAGFVAPRSDNYSVHNTTLVNFDRLGMSALGTCSHCSFFTTQDQGARTTSFTAMRFVKCPSMADWTFPRRAVLASPDGTLVQPARRKMLSLLDKSPSVPTAQAGPSSSLVLTPYRSFLYMPGLCEPQSDWLNALACNASGASGVRLARLTIKGLVPSTLMQSSLVLENSMGRGERHARQGIGGPTVILAVGRAAKHGAGDFGVCMLIRGREGTKAYDWSFQAWDAGATTGQLKPHLSERDGSRVISAKPQMFSEDKDVNITLCGVPNTTTLLQNGDVFKLVPIYDAACSTAVDAATPTLVLLGATGIPATRSEMTLSAAAPAGAWAGMWASAGEFEGNTNCGWATLKAGTLKAVSSSRVPFELNSDPSNAFCSPVPTGQHLRGHFAAELARDASNSGGGRGHNQLTHAVGVDFLSLVLDAKKLAPGDWLLLTLNYTAYRHHFKVSRLRGNVEEQRQFIAKGTGGQPPPLYEGLCPSPPLGNCKQPASDAARARFQLSAARYTLRRMPQPAVDPHGASFHDRGNKTLTVLLKAPTRRRNQRFKQESAHTPDSAGPFLGRLSSDAKQCERAAEEAPEEGGPLWVTAFRCPPEGCSADFKDGQWREPFRRPWTNSSQWPFSRLPLAGDDVTIPFAWSVVLDADPPSIRNLLLEGRLLFDAVREETILRATNIVVAPGGELQAGTRNLEYTAKATILLVGSRQSLPMSVSEIDHTGAGAPPVGAKSLQVLGELNLHGLARGRSWTRLVERAVPGSTALVVDGDVGDWREGEEIVISPTGHKYDEEEVRTLVRVKSDAAASTTRLELDRALLFAHFGAPEVEMVQTAASSNADDRSVNVELRAEVALLSRNVRVLGSDTGADGYGAHIRVGGTYRGDASGRAQLSWVEIATCGQARTQSGALTMTRSAEYAKSSLHAISVRNGKMGGIKVERCKDRMNITDSIVHRASDGSSFDVSSATRSWVTRAGKLNLPAIRSSCRLSRNLALGHHATGSAHLANEIGVRTNTANFALGSNLHVRNNVAAGGYNHGFWVTAERCSLREALRAHQHPIEPVWNDRSVLGSDDGYLYGAMSGNLVHASRVGVFVVPPFGSWCVEVSDFTAVKSFDAGLVFYKAASKLQLGRVTTVDCTIGIIAALVTQSHWARVHMRDMLLVGASIDPGCGYGDDTAQCSQSWEGGQVVPTWLTGGCSQKAGCGGADGIFRKQGRSYPDHMTNAAGSARSTSAASGGRVGILGVVPNEHSNLFAFKYTPPLPPYMPWQNIRGETAFAGLVQIDGVTFANYSREDGCGRVNHAFATNSWASDGHPVHRFSRVRWIGVPSSARFRFDDPSQGWRTNEDCGDGRDCTGLFNVVVHDVDGTLVPLAGELHGSNATGGTTVVSSPHPHSLTSDEELNGGGNITDPNECEWRPEWNAFLCRPKLPSVAGGSAPRHNRHDLLVLENSGGDTKTRRVDPVTVSTYADPLADPLAQTQGWRYVQKLNCFRDEGWDMSYTSMKRRARFPVSLRLGRHYRVAFAGTNPRDMRIALSSAAHDEGVVLTLFYQSPEQIEVRREWNMELVTPSSESQWSALTAMPQGGQFSRADYDHGANVWMNLQRKLSLVVRGKEPLLLRTLNSVKVSLKLAMTTESFYDSGGTEAFVNRLAFTLGIPRSRIRSVSVVAARRRRLAQGELVEARVVHPSPGKNGGASRFLPAEKLRRFLLRYKESRRSLASDTALAISFSVVEDTNKFITAATHNASRSDDSTEQPNADVDPAAAEATASTKHNAAVDGMLQELKGLEDKLTGSQSTEPAATSTSVAGTGVLTSVVHDLGLGQLLEVESVVDKPPSTPCIHVRIRARFPALRLRPTRPVRSRCGRRA
eukprot:g124.t1